MTYLKKMTHGIGFCLLVYVSSAPANAYMVEAIKDVQNNRVAQVQYGPIIIEGIKTVGTSFRENGIPAGQAIKDSAQFYYQRWRDGQRMQQPSPLPQPVFSQNRYGYTQTCNRYGCLSVPNH
jgi:hypothetical protein